MCENFAQTNIFNIREYQTEEQQAREDRKRGFYKKKQPQKIILNPYTEMKNLYELLANYLPLPLFLREERVFTYKKLRVWHMIYFDEEKQVEFPVSEAEIIGTENMDIKDRIQLHKGLIDLLRGGLTLDEALEVFNGKQ